MSPSKRSVSEQENDFISNSNLKRLRGGGLHDDDFIGEFNNDALFDEDDLVIDNYLEQQNIVPENALDEAARILEGSEQQRWKRPELPVHLTNSDDLNMLWIDMDVVSGDPLEKNPNQDRLDVVGSHEGKVPILRTFGVTNAGHSVAAFIHGFTPYGYFSLPPGYRFVDTEANRKKIRQFLDTRLLKERSAVSSNLTHAVLGVDYTESMKSMYGYDTRQTKFFKIYVSLPGLIPALKRIMEDGVDLAGIVLERESDVNSTVSSQLEYSAFECNIPFVLRFLVDRGVAGAGWLTFPSKTYQIRPSSATVSHCQVSLMN